MLQPLLPATLPSSSTSASPSSVPCLSDGRFFSPQDIAFFAHTVQQTNFTNLTGANDLIIDESSPNQPELSSDLTNLKIQTLNDAASASAGNNHRVESPDCIILDSPSQPSPKIATPHTTNSSSSLTRARGELLRRKIEQRPTRERLITQRILLSDGRVAPLIEQKARLLKKDRIRSSLDKKLSRRPGPLELVTKKILRADAELERDIEEGRLLFKPIESAESPCFGRRGMQEFEDALSPITLDMEVLPNTLNTLPRALSKPVNVLSNKGILRKSKPSPYKTAEPMPVKAKTKSFDNKEDAFGEDRLSTASPNVDKQNSNYKLLLQQQQLFLQYQHNEDQTELSLSTNESPDIFPISSPPNNLVSSTNQILRPAPRRLSAMKVSELKNECKKRNLPVSGPKPHLVDRLRIYEREILGCTPAPSPEPSETSLPSVVNGSTGTGGSGLILESQRGSMDATEANSMSTSNGIMNCTQSVSLSQPMQEATPRPAQLTIHDYLTSQNQRPLVLLPTSGQQVVQVIDSKGQLLGMATMQCQPNIVPASSENTVILNRTLSNEPSSQAPRLVPTSTRAVIQGKENTFRFAQMGSGGQFTVSPEMQSKIPVAPLPQSTQILSNPLIPGAPRQVIVQSVIPQSQVMLLHPAPNGSIQTIAPLQQQGPKLISQTPVVSVLNGSIPAQNGVRLSSPSLNGGSPRTADQASSSPNLPLPNSVSSEGTSNVAMSADIIEGEGTNDSPILIDNVDPATLLTPQTLQKREEMLRTQQKKIETLMREVADAQKMLKIEQELIIAAKKTQAKMREQQREQDQQDERTRWLRENDFGQMNKQHIQHFLHHKMLQGQIRKFSTEHNRLANTEVRLQEELHVEQAVHDIVRLIKQDPRTALLIVQLLRKFQVERQQEKDKTNIDEVHGVPNIVAQTTKAKKNQNKKQDKDVEQPMQCEPEKPIDKMDEVFKSVLESATRETENHTPPAVECSLSTSFSKRSSIHHWHPTSSLSTSTTSSTTRTSTQPPCQTISQQLNETSLSAAVTTISHPQAAASCSQLAADGTVEVFPQQGGSTQMSLSQVNYNEQMSDSPEAELTNQTTTTASSHGFDEPNIEDIFDVLDKDINGSLHWNFNIDSYGSQALADLTGPDAWLDDINRHIAQNGQYASFDMNEDEGGRRTDPMCMGSIEGMDGQQPMDWMDQILIEAPVEAQTTPTSTTNHGI